MTVSFHVTRSDALLIGQIVERGYPMLKKAWGDLSDEKMKKLGADAMSLSMDITACHANGTPLRLQEFLDADDFNFAHDFVGIHNCIDRETGRMTRHFLPRFHRAS